MGGNALSNLLDQFLSDQSLRQLIICLSRPEPSSPTFLGSQWDYRRGWRSTTFIPQIFMLFACISLLEDSGYMARAALVTDRVMQLIGLNGKSFIPLIIGFGCNVTGIMAARTIEQPKERLVTTLIMPFMSCSARLPIYSLVVAAFFPHHQALIILSVSFGES
ncbi:MAG: nucleoside recognition domain-containing protein [Limosilactobacillus pontis]